MVTVTVCEFQNNEAIGTDSEYGVSEGVAMLVSPRTNTNPRYLGRRNFPSTER